MSLSHRTLLLVALLAAFAFFHPYFDAAGLCGLGGCQEPSQSSHDAPDAGYWSACSAAVLVASGATARAFASFSGPRRVADHPRPPEAYLSPDTPPPRALLGRP